MVKPQTRRFTSKKQIVVIIIIFWGCDIIENNCFFAINKKPLGSVYISMKVILLTYNPIEENTYILFDETGECAIVDPGCYFPEEKQHLVKTIKEHKLKPAKLLNTHCHFDHIFGNKFVAETFGLLPEYHINEERVLSAVYNRGIDFGFQVEPSPKAKNYIQDQAIISFGNTSLQCFYTPGHSPGGVCFYHKPSNQMIVGDVIFEMSIGRTDLPGGSYETLMRSIYQVILPLPENTILYPGHGRPTTVEKEKKYNPFLRN
jgi:glyoxylase-like metal-dependent hydrolase (beta-lactamase superfamily II)